MRRRGGTGLMELELGTWFGLLQDAALGGRLAYCAGGWGGERIGDTGLQQDVVVQPQKEQLMKV